MLIPASNRTRDLAGAQVGGAGTVIVQGTKIRRASALCAKYLQETARGRGHGGFPGWRGKFLNDNDFLDVSVVFFVERSNRKRETRCVPLVSPSANQNSVVMKGAMESFPAFRGTETSKRGDLVGSFRMRQTIAFQARAERFPA